MNRRNDAINTLSTLSKFHHIDPDTLLHLQSQLSSTDLQRGSPGFGLRNVNHRLKLFYGSDYVRPAVSQHR